MSADQSKKFHVPDDIENKYDELYKMYIANVNEKYLDDDGI